MSLNLPQLIDTYIRAQNAYDADRVPRDVGRHHSGENGFYSLGVEQRWTEPGTTVASPRDEAEIRKRAEVQA